jgi:hypothetical protein
MVVVPNEQTQDPDLVLRLRLDSLRKNLNQISQAEVAISRLHENVKYLRDSALETGSGIDWRLDDLRSSLDRAMKSIQRLTAAPDLPAGIFETPLESLETAVKLADAITGRVTEMLKTLEGLWEPLQQLAPDDLKDPLNNSLIHESEQRANTVKRLESRLRTRRGGKPPDRAKIWAEYERLAYQDGEPLFGEYVDLLGGLALRNTGIDSGICAMADALIRRLHYVGGRERLYHSVAVPARRGAPERTMARIIRLGFPEWTVWAVPLAAHEYGHVGVADH